MAKTVEKIGKTVEEAVNMAIEELKVDKDNIDIEVIEEGNKGLFGLIGSKQAHVIVTVKENRNNKAKEFLDNVFREMDLDVGIEMEEAAKEIKINLKGDKMGILIGRRGETLDALQYLTSIVVNKGNEDYKKIFIDTENYRSKREETLTRLANNVAERVIKMEKSVTLEPMNPYERRIIHSTLQKNKYVETYSIDDEPYRKVVISPK